MYTILRLNTTILPNPPHLDLLESTTVMLKVFGVVWSSTFQKGKTMALLAVKNTLNVFLATV